jgi:hypothetical protein
MKKEKYEKMKNLGGHVQQTALPWLRHCPNSSITLGHIEDTTRCRV